MRSGTVMSAVVVELINARKSRVVWRDHQWQWHIAREQGLKDL